MAFCGKFLFTLAIIFNGCMVQETYARYFRNTRNAKELLQKTHVGSSNKIIGLVPAHNEQAIVAQCLKVLSLYTDAIVFLDDASDDNTLEIVESLRDSCKIESIIRKTGWYRDEPDDRNKLLDEGRRLGGTHFIVLDADELFTANCVENQFLRKMILALEPGERLSVNWIHLWRSTKYYRFDSSKWCWHYKPIIFCDDKNCSYDSEFIHTPRIPENLKGKTFKLEGYEYGFMHFQFVNWQNLLIKQAWYRCLEHIRDPQKSCNVINDLYRPSKDESNINLELSPACWFAAYSFFDATVYDEPVTWREKHILEWFQNYGRNYFAELDIWDINWDVICQR